MAITREGLCTQPAPNELNRTGGRQANAALYAVAMSRMRGELGTRGTRNCPPVNDEPTRDPALYRPRDLPAHRRQPSALAEHRGILYWGSPNTRVQKRLRTTPPSTGAEIKIK